MYCPNCNKTFPDNHAFCDNCGGKLVEQPQAQSVTPVVQQAPTHAPYPQPAYSAPAYAASGAPAKNETVSFGAWFGISVLNILPFFFGLIVALAIIIGGILQLISGSFDFSTVSPIGLIFVVLTVLYVIMLFIWAFGGSRKRSLKNYARATLLMSLILIVIGIIGYFVLRDSILSTFNLQDLLNNYQITY